MIVQEKYLQPSTIREAIGMADKYEQDFKYLAGGTDVMVNRFQGNESAWNQEL